MQVQPGDYKAYQLSTLLDTFVMLSSYGPVSSPLLDQMAQYLLSDSSTEQLLSLRHLYLLRLAPLDSLATLVSQSPEEQAEQLIICLRRGRVTVKALEGVVLTENQQKQLSSYPMVSPGEEVCLYDETYCIRLVSSDPGVVPPLDSVIESLFSYGHKGALLRHLVHSVLSLALDSHLEVSPSLFCQVLSYALFPRECTADPFLEEEEEGEKEGIQADHRLFASHDFQVPNYASSLSEEVLTAKKNGVPNSLAAIGERAVKSHPEHHLVRGFLATLSAECQGRLT